MPTTGLKTIHTRIQLKNDIEEHWELATNFIPLDGEVIIYDIDANHTSPRLKIGDGTTKVADLPFVKNEYIVEDNILILK